MLLFKLTQWLAGIIVQIPGWLGDLGAKLIEWFTSAFNWVKDNGPTILLGILTWFSELPGKLWEKIGDLGQFIHDKFWAAFDWLKINLPLIVQPVIDWFASIPGWIWDKVGDLGQFIHDKFWDTFEKVKLGLPIVVGGVIDWFKSLPGWIWDKVGNIGQFLIDKLKEAFTFITTELPNIVKGVIDWFGGMGTTIFNAIKDGLTSAGGAVTDFAKGLWNSLAGFLNEKLMTPLREFDVPVLGKIFDWMPKFLTLAEGGIFNTATFAMIGEAGREAVVPLENQAAGVRVAREAGIPGMLARASAREAGIPGIPARVGEGVGGGLSLQVNVSVNPPAGSDQGWARAMGNTVGETAAAEATRRLRMTAAIRSA